MRRRRRYLLSAPLSGLDLGPAAFIAGMLVWTYSWYVDGPHPLAVFAPVILLIACLVLLARENLPRRVAVDAEGLLVSNFLWEDRVPFDQLERVETVDGGRVQLTRITLSRPCRFGAVVEFVPFPTPDHHPVLWLRERMRGDAPTARLPYDDGTQAYLPVLQIVEVLHAVVGGGCLALGALWSMLSDPPSPAWLPDGGAAAGFALFGALCLAASLGMARRRAWARWLGFACGWIAVAAFVLLTMADHPLLAGATGLFAIITLKILTCPLPRALPETAQ